MYIALGALAKGNISLQQQGSETLRAALTPG